jgi:hypothetical protein
VNLVVFAMVSACSGNCPTPTPSTPASFGKCPCDALKLGVCANVLASILGISLNLPVDLSLILNYCGKTVPTGFKCLSCIQPHARRRCRV